MRERERERVAAHCILRVENTDITKCVHMYIVRHSQEFHKQRYKSVSIACEN